jgi:hypothetical protein
MPQLDSCHPQVVKALEKAGWRVVVSPFRLEAPLTDLFADILAERTPETDHNEIIVVEVKCFSDKKAQTTEVYTAIGQYLVYRELLIANSLDYPIYLAIPTQAFYGIFEAIGMSVGITTQIKLIVIDLEREEIVQWMESYEKKSN